MGGRGSASGGGGGGSGGTALAEAGAAAGGEPVAGGAGVWEPDTAAQDRIQASVGKYGQGVAHEESLSGGVSGETDKLTMKDGSTLVRKDRGGDQEQAASMIGQAVGLPAPAVYVGGPGRVYMEYVDAPSAARALSTGKGYYDFDKQRFEQLVHSDDGARIGLLDHLITNIDRNPGNWLVKDDGGLVPIDHGHAFAHTPALDSPGMRLPVRADVGTNFAGRYVELDNTASYTPYKWADNPLTQADVAEVRTRLQRLEPEFARLGLPAKYLKYAQHVLDEIGKHATGTRNLIAGVP